MQRAGEDVGMIIAHPAAENLGAKPRASGGAQAPSRPIAGSIASTIMGILTGEKRGRVAPGGKSWPHRSEGPHHAWRGKKPVIS
jgi:hypothetical protein